MTRVPGWTRIEPDRRATGVAAGARIPLADPLWLLGRQWWVGELDGADGGAPIRAEVAVAIEPIADAHRGSGPRVPWQTRARPVDHLLREPTAAGRTARRRALVRGRLLLGMIDDALATSPDPQLPRMRERLTSEFALDPQNALARRRQAAAGAPSLDGDALLAFASRQPDDFHAMLPRIGQRWLDAVGAAVGPDGITSSPDDDAFDLDRRTHHAGLYGEDGTSARASEADGPQLRWDDLQIEVGAVPSFAIHRPVPVRASFEGQPPPRWWTTTDHEVDHVAAPVGPTDLPRLLVAAAFAEQGHDRWLLPIEVPTESFVHVGKVRLYDGFGVVTQHAAGGDDGLRLWDPGGNGDVRSALVIAGLPHLSGQAVEELELRADDIENLVWAIERIVPDADGRGRRREVRPEVEELDGADVVLREAPAASWIPYLRDAAGDLVRTPLGAEQGSVEPRGTLAVERLDVRREQLPQAGLAVRRMYRLARSADGDRMVWVARIVVPADVSGGSGLRHDVIRRPEAGPSR